jgi:uncharacterized membrane protein
MSDLLVIAYPTEAQAEAARGKLLGMQKEYLIELGDAVVAVRQPDGQVKLNVEASVRSRDARPRTAGIGRDLIEAGLN